MDQVEVVQNHLDSSGVLRLVLDGEWRLDYFNIRDGVTDVVLVRKNAIVD
jgi:hypothetical protein